jgi:hypothetical protein
VGRDVVQDKIRDGWWGVSGSECTRWKGMVGLPDVGKVDGTRLGGLAFVLVGRWLASARIPMG